ncbi:MAG: hypothetical protein IT258_07305 [Saprospiraceae bacterium]|nr:hypothetical protein [Saprospiraceae bacterium]
MKKARQAHRQARPPPRRLVHGNPAKARSTGIPLASARRLPPSSSGGQKRHWSPMPADSTYGGTRRARARSTLLPPTAGWWCANLLETTWSIVIGSLQLVAIYS